ncbi:MAG: hypothetical protein DPW21_00430 [Anaerolineae bacterium]|nr:hypothetical protein [Chloroflexi bacterium CFX2]MCQ3945148.1 hypothetical protein [Anaerolineae bacterium]MCZ7550921.1 hypothetical protein [Anaerolineales bacterium]GER79170.1 conserved hypothetical protein [Candidatus Denitrolinea symbiosum]HPO84986.1 hypothetical protein [Candidatus Hydrogenedentota bacterium]
MTEETVGSTRTFVLAKGFTQAGNHAALIGDDDSKRLFAELFADPDRPEVRPQEAYQAMLSSIQPGWTIRLIQVFWPDPEPRIAFQRQVQEWKIPEIEGLNILQQGLVLATQEYPLPFVRRTILEFVQPGDEGLAWWEGLTGLCAGFGIRVSYLEQAGIEELTRWVLNPNLEYQRS